MNKLEWTIVKKKICIFIRHIHNLYHLENISSYLENYDDA